MEAKIAELILLLIEYLDFIMVVGTHFLLIQ